MFNQNTALSIVQDQSSEFKINLEDLSTWCGYSYKKNAKRSLVNLGMIEGIDFCSELSKNPSLGRPREIILLNMDAAKHFCMASKTDQGKEVRQYFIEAEKQLRENLPTINTLPEKSVKEEFEEAEALLSFIGSDLDLNIGTQLRLSISAEIMPQYTPLLEEAKIQVSLENSREAGLLLTPTEVGKNLEEKGLGKFTAQAINKLLASMGFQHPIVKYKPSTQDPSKKTKKTTWQPFEKAWDLELCQWVDPTPKAGSGKLQKVTPQLRWDKKILAILEDHLS